MIVKYIRRIEIKVYIAVFLVDIVLCIKLRLLIKIVTTIEIK